MKKIEIVHLKPSELKHNFGNPRKITKSKIEELKKSLKMFGDHDIIKIDENNNIISGSQRIEAMIQLGIDTTIACKRLIGYTEQELKIINIKSNTHSGEWDIELYNDWIKDIDIIDYSGLIKYEDIELEYESETIGDIKGKKCPNCGYEFKKINNKKGQDEYGKIS